MAVYLISVPLLSLATATEGKIKELLQMQPRNKVVWDWGLPLSWNIGVVSPCYAHNQVETMQCGKLIPASPWLIPTGSGTQLLNCYTIISHSVPDTRICGARLWNLSSVPNVFFQYFLSQEANALMLSASYIEPPPWHPETPNISIMG